MDLRGYDFILGVDWIFTHSPIGLNLKSRELCVNHYGRRKVTFIVETLPAANCIVPIEKLQKMMDKGVVGAVVYVCDTSEEFHKKIVTLLK